MSIVGYDSWLHAQADAHMRTVGELCECCGKELAADGRCYACEEFDKNDEPDDF